MNESSNSTATYSRAAVIWANKRTVFKHRTAVSDIASADGAQDRCHAGRGIHGGQRVAAYSPRELLVRSPAIG